jgi:hypothetical protein
VSAGLGGWNVEGARIARTCADVVSDLDGSSVRRCTQLVVDPSGILVTYDPVRRVLTRERSEAETVNSELPDEFDDPRLLAAGPDGVVYIELPNVWPDPSDVIAVALVPGDTGRVIERWDGVLPVGDLDVLASSSGLVVSGWYETGPRPSIDRAPIVPWITRDSSIITVPTLLATFDDANSTVSANGWMWSLAERSVVGDQPGASWVVPTFDGGFLALYSQTNGDQRAELIRGWRNGVLEYAEFPMSPVRIDGSIVLEPQGTVLLPTTDGYLRVAPFEEQPTGWTGGLQVDPTSATATAVGLDAFLDTIDWPVEGQSHVWPWGTGPVAFANAVAGPASSAAEVRTIEATFTAGDEVAVSVTIEGLLDDSVYGVRYVMLITWLDGPGFRIERIDWASSCQPDRGHQDYSSELCV